MKITIYTIQIIIELYVYDYKQFKLAIIINTYIYITKRC